MDEKNQRKMTTHGHCPVRGSISVNKDVSGVCSAPIGAGDSSMGISFYRALVPNGTKPLESQIDQLGYQLYDLTAEEIAIIENSIQ